MTDLDHLLLTRFYVRIKSGAQLPSEQWLKERIDSFEHVCLPSVRAQTSLDFRWLLFIDAESPVWVTEYLASVIPPNAEVVVCEGVCDGSLISDAVSRRTHRSKVITSRVDSDDALHPAFIETVADRLREETGVFLNFPDGLQLSRGRLLSYSHPSNPFISLVEPTGPNLMTVFVDWHDRLGRHGPIVQQRGYRAWVQNCHGANVRNQERGIRVWAPRDKFGYEMLALRRQNLAEYFLDLTSTTVRAMVSVLRRPARLRRLIQRRV
ncbi:glycosyltransferase [Microbacterium plantarum]|uniref:Glycosyltransferase n=1 Tax=Microbacterium plantarum TaxID=1816425 RepID=A0ABV5EVV6_9MICO